MEEELVNGQVSGVCTGETAEALRSLRRILLPPSAEQAKELRLRQS